MRLLPGLCPGPRWGAYCAPQTPHGKDCASRKKCHLFFFPMTCLIVCYVVGCVWSSSLAFSLFRVGSSCIHSQHSVVVLFFSPHSCLSLHLSFGLPIFLCPPSSIFHVIFTTSCFVFLSTCPNHHCLASLIFLLTCLPQLLLLFLCPDLLCCL